MSPPNVAISQDALRMLEFCRIQRGEIKGLKEIIEGCPWYRHCARHMLTFAGSENCPIRIERAWLLRKGPAIFIRRFISGAIPIWYDLLLPETFDPRTVSSGE